MTNALVWGCMFLFVVIAFYTDHTRMIIPNQLTISMTLTGLVLHTSLSGLEGLMHAFIGMIGSLTALFVIYLCRGVEAGDVKLFAALGAVGGLEVSLTMLVYSLVIAAAVGIAVLITRRFKSRDMDKTQAHNQFPFMYAVLPGFILTWVAMEVPLLWTG
jgi:prepilin peptidase CpaA